MDGVKRRLSAIVCADVAGYSRLVNVDEAGTLTALKAHRQALDPVVASHGGRIVKTTGDGTLLEFPSAVSAVACAVAVQLLMARRNEGVPANHRMFLRIGIHSGEIVVDGDDILGNDVNIAARLESIAKRGGICISAEVWRQVHGKVPVPLLDLGEQRLKNIAEPIRVFEIAPVLPKGRGPAATALDAAAPLDQARGKISLVVLPFAAWAGDAGQQAFADSLTEDITTDLAQVRDRFVVARNTAFTYKGRPIDVPQIGRELGVRYALEGSVQKHQAKLRINVQLIDADSGGHLWAERFDTPEGDPFNTRDVIAARIVRAVGLQLNEHEIRRHERDSASKASVAELVALGWAHTRREISRESWSKAVAAFQGALRASPDSAAAAGGLCYAYAIVVQCGWSSAPEADLQAANGLLDRMRALDPGSNLYWHATAMLALAQRRLDVALQAVRQLNNPNHPAELAVAGLVHLYAGDAQLAIASTERAMQASPRDPQTAVWSANIGMAHLSVGRFQEAIDHLTRSTSLCPTLDWAFLCLAGALAQVGRRPEAASAVTAALRCSPEWTTGKVGALLPSASSQLLAGLREAGLPE